MQSARTHTHTHICTLENDCVNNFKSADDFDHERIDPSRSKSICPLDCYHEEHLSVFTTIDPDIESEDGACGRLIVVVFIRPESMLSHSSSGGSTVGGGETQAFNRTPIECLTPVVLCCEL